MIRTLTISAFAAAAFALPAAAVEETSIKVDYAADLLETDAGAKAVYSEIKDAAETVCEQKSATERLRFMIAERKCEADAVDTAVAKIDAPRLTALHAAAAG